jgi:malate dehydrogenase (oxaloacetate-decarboxylating)(NADP+)
MTTELRQNALHYHSTPIPGKLEIAATKPMATQVDLSLAYSPGVAAPCEEIAADPALVSRFTGRGNLVAVITNGTAVLGLGAIGPLAAKPVMEGKAVLFKKFSGINVFDIEVAERDPDLFVETVARLEPTFGGINLEDIKAPECFAIEEKLRDRLSIPVFHDDQHGTAIITAAAVLNGLRVVAKRIEAVRIAVSGAGAAGIACLDLLVRLGLEPANIVVCDSRGVIYQGREAGMDDRKARYAADTEVRTLAEAIEGADIFLGVSQPGVLTASMVERMAERPLIFALANPVPEILPEEARAVRPDAVIATGRSDYPNQVNNVLCFPYIFRGALDVGATTINEEMKLACVRALADLAIAEPDEEVAAVYAGQPLEFGPEYLIPKPFDPRLIVEIPLAVARAAMESGVASRPISDLRAYREQLERFVFRSGMLMKPVFDMARQSARRVVYAEGEEPRVLRAVQVVVDDGLAMPVLIGRREVVVNRIASLGLRLQLGRDFDLVDPQQYEHYERCWQAYHTLMRRRGVAPDLARMRVRTRSTVLGALLVHLNVADALICGTIGRYHKHLRHLIDILGLRDGVRQAAAMHAMILSKGTFFLCDTNVNTNPDSEQIAGMTLLAAQGVRRFGLAPKVALLSHANFGNSGSSSARKMAEAVALLHRLDPDLEVEGEMQADVALAETLRERVFPDSRLQGQANLLIMPNLDSANIAFNMVKMLGDGISVGPILMGINRPAHVLTPAATVRRIINMTALAVVEAGRESAAEQSAPPRQIATSPA